MNALAVPAIRSKEYELRVYNSLVLGCQDEAYSLAVDLLGNESTAAALVQEVFLSGFARRKDPRLPFRLRALQWVVRTCLERSRKLPGPARLEPRLGRLSNDEQVAVVLIERLGLSYTEAAAVLGLKNEEFRGLLARARQKMCGGSERY